MSLATRCTACHTVFRVVQDQLKVSEGWVRCGRCNEVFNALEGLFDLAPAAPPAQPSEAPPEPASPLDAPTGDRFEPPALAAPAGAEPVMAAPPAAGEATWPDDGGIEAASAPAGIGRAAVQPDTDPEPEPDATPASRVAARDRLDFADAQFNNALLAEDGIDVPADSSTPPDDAAAPADPPPPEFVRQAERQARRDRPGTVWALSLAAVLLALGLGAQAALHFRDLLAVMAPSMRPALEALCGVAQCRIEPLRRIDDIVIESSALTAAPSGGAVRLSLVLRNRGAWPVALPSIDLTLADPAGKLLVRRALSPADFAAASAVLAPGAESALQLVMTTGGRAASGYTVEPFYP